MIKKVGHAREMVAKATKGMGKVSAPKSPKGNSAYCPNMSKSKIG